MLLPTNSTGPLCEADPDNHVRCAYHRTEHEATTEPVVEVTVTVSAQVASGYGPADLADVIRFHLNLSSLDSLEMDVSAVHITNARVVSAL